MEVNLKLKVRLYEKCSDIIQNRINEIQADLKKILESKLKEQKSTVGDKYETGRSMLQQEETKLKMQLLEFDKLNMVLNLIEVNKIVDKIALGSIVITNKMNLFLSVGLGKIVLEEGGHSFFAISGASPIGKAIYGKKAGDLFELNGNSYKIEMII